MHKTNKILLTIIIVLAAALMAIVYWQKVGFNKDYWAVYLDTGDLYFGKLSYFPKASLSNAYILQRNAQDSQNPFSISAGFEQGTGIEITAIDPDHAVKILK
ncbi:MAG: hypothetical protein M1170_00165 [Patescibacteria group bacterium]|nr:hypothetical protein [Patescibacteria group bacterium]